MFFKGILSKVSNVAKLEFDDKREQAIYNLGVDAGERQSAMKSSFKIMKRGVLVFLIQ
jgi:hypothetical protein